MNDNKLLLLILENLQKKEEEKEINEKSFTYAAAKAAAAGKKEFTFQGKKHPVKMSKEKAEKIISEIENELNEKRKRKKRKKRKKRAKHIKPTKGEIEYRAKKYAAPPKSKRAKGLAKAASLYKQGKVKQAALVRQRMEAGERKKKSFKNKPRHDTKIAESAQIEELKDLIEEIYELDLLNKFIFENNIQEEEYLLESDSLDEKRKRKKRKKKKKSGKSSKGLSAAVKRSLDKKADRRGLTRGSVYAEFRKGLAAFLSSGSRKGMTAHQWAHARVNSANPSKSWAVVKKKKGGKKKK